MSVYEILIVAMGACILGIAALIVKKIRNFSTPPADEDEISERVRRLIAESAPKSEEPEDQDNQPPPVQPQ